MLGSLVVGTVLVVGPVSPAAPARPPLPAALSQPTLSASPSPQRPPARAWTWPLDGPPRVVRAFSPPAQPWLPGHRGVDLAGQEGLRVRAAGRGMVVYAGRIADRGVISVAHAGGLRTTYEPVMATVSAGQQVETGEPLGILEAGHAGCPVDTCLHWGLRRDETYLNPLWLVQPFRLRLKPANRAL
jgi:murein DD-endopeptidase MepM/ murein hydrolase activator NlpD